MWSIWDKKTDMNGFSASSWFESFPHLRNEETIYIKTINGRTVQIEGKSILANNYNIDPTLPDDEFIAEYERILAAPPEEEIPDEEETDTTTYAELAQVYAEGVNSIE